MATPGMRGKRRRGEARHHEALEGFWHVHVRHAGEIADPGVDEGLQGNSLSWICSSLPPHAVAQTRRLTGRADDRRDGMDDPTEKETSFRHP